MKSVKSEANRVKLYATALAYLDTDASPNDLAPDELGCADTVSAIIHSAFGAIIKYSVSTAELKNILDKSPHFKRVTTFKFGDIILSPTSPGRQPGKLTNGHVGIVGEDEEVMSNDSRTGMFKNNYTVTSWVKRYRELGKYSIYFYRKI